MTLSGALGCDFEYVASRLLILKMAWGERDKGRRGASILISSKVNQTWRLRHWENFTV